MFAGFGPMFAGFRPMFARVEFIFAKIESIFAEMLFTTIGSYSLFGYLQTFKVFSFNFYKEKILVAFY
ncbi:hypothetical protein NUACC21_60950 [Scytonema sp. NUACC21]